MFYTVSDKKNEKKIKIMLTVFLFDDAVDRPEQIEEPCEIGEGLPPLFSQKQKLRNEFVYYRPKIAENSLFNKD